MQVHLYLAELVDAAGRVSEAILHYRAHLQLVVQQQARRRPNPAVLIPVILKFGDALAGSAQPDQARAQYELAIKMAQQTGLQGLERTARERLASQS